MTLYNFHRSSASFRVRIALAHKGLAYSYVPVDLLTGEGAHRTASYRDVNPQALVPFLVDGDVRIGQSLAILEYLEDAYPAAPLLPPDPAGRARVRSLCQFVAAEIQAVNGLRLGKYLARELGASPDAVKAWRTHWIVEGFDAIEAGLGQGVFCHGEQLTLADCLLVPQAWYATANLGMSLGAWPRIDAVVRHAWTLPAVQAAAPERQPDAR